jgi:outer membrane receptor for ferrienterochelin and colicins
MTRKHLFLIFLLIGWSCLAFTQVASIKVFDKGTKQALGAANLLFKGVETGAPHATITSLSGEAVNPVTEKSQIVISYVGYKTFIDTVHPGESKIFYLEQDAFHIHQVVITATRTKKSLKDAPVITRLITAKQIEEVGFESVEEVLEMQVPGIEFNRRGISTDISMQGLEAENILILIDGERLAGETRGNIDYSRLNINDIEQIEIIKGASSALYGSQAMGAVINIITKSSKQKVYASVLSQYSNFSEINYPDLKKDDEHYDWKKNLDKPNLNIGTVFGFNLKKFSSKTNFTYKTTDAYQLYDRDSLVKEYVDIDTIIYEPLNKTPTGIEGTQDITIYQKFGYRFNQNYSLDVYGSYYQKDKYDFYREDKRRDAFDDYTYGLKFTYLADNQNTILFSINSDTYNKYDYLEKLEEKRLNYRDKYINPRLLADYTLGSKQQFTVGLEYLYESLLTDMFIYGELIDKEVSTYIAFAQDEIQFNSRLNLIAGLRAEYNTAFGPHFTPKLSLMYKWIPVTFRLNYAAGYRSPGLKELYMDWDHLGMFIIKGNPDLKPETNDYFSASAELSNSWVNTSVTAYYNYFSDKIEGQWSNDQTEYQYQNISNSSLFGTDFLLKLKLSEAFMIKAGYSYVNDKNYDEGVRLSAISPHTANFQLEYAITKRNYGLRANVSGKFVGPKDFNVLDELEYLGDTVEAYYKVHYDGYWIWRFSVGQRFYNSMNLVLGVENLFDYTAPVVTFNSSISPGRRFFISLNIEIDKFYNQIKSK